jgi:hypothetical protein
MPKTAVRLTVRCLLQLVSLGGCAVLCVVGEAPGGVESVMALSGVLASGRRP